MYTFLYRNTPLKISGIVTNATKYNLSIKCLKFVINKPQLYYIRIDRPEIIDFVNKNNEPQKYEPKSFFNKNIDAFIYITKKEPHYFRTTKIKVYI